MGASLLSFLPTTKAARAIAQVRLTLIWTEVGRDCELVVSPITQSVIRGEVNVLRYLARLFPSILPYESHCVHFLPHPLLPPQSQAELQAEVKTWFARLGSPSGKQSSPNKRQSSPTKRQSSPKKRHSESSSPKKDAKGKEGKPAGKDVKKEKKSPA